MLNSTNHSTTLPEIKLVAATNAYRAVSDYNAMRTPRIVNETAANFRLMNRMSRHTMTMTDFYALDADGQIACLTALAHEALIHYGLNFAALELVNYSNNAVFHVHAGTHHYILRIHRPGLKRLAWIRSELAWLSALRRDTDLQVPEPAAPIYIGSLPGVDEPVYSVLLRWLPGETMTPQTLTTGQARQTGIFAAKLHWHSERFAAPEDFERPRLDYDGMFGVNSPYYPGEAGEALLTDTHRAVISAAQMRVRTVMDLLDDTPGSFGLIHADLIAKNLLWDVQNETVAALDFDDCAYGYYLYELAPLLWFLRSEPNAADLRTALWEGYTSVRSLPEAYQSHLDTLVAARHIASIRWIAGNQHNPSVRGRVTEIIVSRINELQRFLDTGRL